MFLSSEKNVKNEESVGLIDYIDYGEEGNHFLRTIGVLSSPTPVNLVHLLLERHSSYFQIPSSNQSEEILAKKSRFYLNCLKQLSSVAHLTRELSLEPLKSRLMNERWCLAYRTTGNEENKDRQVIIDKPSSIYLDDDHQSAIDLRPLCAPDEPELFRFYEFFGAKWLSESVQRTLKHQGQISSSERTKQLKELLSHRLDMLFVNNRVRLFRLSSPSISFFFREFLWIRLILNDWIYCE